MLMTMRAAIAAACVYVLASCAGTGGPIGPPATNLAQPFSAESYAVAPTDVLQIDVYREADLSGDYAVDPSGTINMPLIGRVSVAGETPQTIERKIRLRLSQGFLVDPDVRVSVLKFRPIYIAGEVEDPGQYAFVPGMTVQQAIVLAGGDTPFASDKYYLQRGVDSKRIRVDAGSILFPGDVITVGERVF